MEQHIIYKITSPKGKVYIGRTINFESRMVEHKCEANKLRRDYPLYRAIRKYGWDNFTKEVLATVVGEDAAILLEASYIEKYDAVKKGYNSTYNTVGGGNVWNGNPEGLKLFKKKMARLTAGKKNGMFGKKQTEEAKQKQREKAKGRFSLQWYVDRHGDVEGTRLYKERSEKLKQRNLQRSTNGTFTKGG